MASRASGRNGWFKGTCSCCRAKAKLVHKIFSSQICQGCADRADQLAPIVSLWRKP